MDYTYDAAGNLLTAKDRAGHGTTYAYDSLHRRTAEKDANNKTTQFTYDLVGNMLSLTDPEANTTSWQYDALDRVTQETNELGYSRFYSYDLVGNLTQKIDRNTHVIQYDYDRLDRLTTESWFGGVNSTSPEREIVFSYDLAGRLLSSSDPDHDYNFTYDRRDLNSSTKVSSQVSGLAYPFEFSSYYDLAGRLAATSVLVADPNEVNQVGDYSESYLYDNLNRMKRVYQTYSIEETSVDRRVDFTYDLANQLTGFTRYFDWSGSSAVAVSQYSYDFAGRIDEIAHYSGSNPQTGDLLAGYDYTWDNRNRLTAMNFLPNGTNSEFNYQAENVAYNYDNRGQLTGADYSGTTNDESYTYDDNGNRDTANGDTYEIDPNNQLVSDGTYSYEYDAEGNITRSWAGNTYTQYHWDHRNRLIQVDSGFNGGPVFRSIEYRYDAQNQLVGRRVFLNGDTTASESQVFVHHNGQVVLQFDGTGNGDLDYNDLSHRYLWGPAVDMLLADEFIDTEQEYNLGEVTWPLADHLGSVRDVIDNAANVIDHAIYDSYGRLVEETSLATPFQWTGKYRDPLTGLQFNLNRWYNPELGRWMSEDPIGFAAGDANRNRYVENGPITLVDPDGLKSEWHHLLPEAYKWYWPKIGINPNSPEFGWILDDSYHRNGPGNTIHPDWNDDWKKCFKDANGKPKKEQVLKQLDEMKLKYSHILRNGKPAPISYHEWRQWQGILRDAARRSKLSKSNVKVKLPGKSIVDKFGKVVKVIPVIVFTYTAANDGVAVAAEGCTEDALWPFLDIARAGAEPFATLQEEMTKNGQLQRKVREHWIDRLLEDPQHTDIPKTGQ